MNPGRPEEAKNEPQEAPGEAQKGLPEAQNEPPEAPGANVIKMSLPKCPPARQYSTFGAPGGAPAAGGRARWEGILGSLNSV